MPKDPLCVVAVMAKVYLAHLDMDAWMQRAHDQTALHDKLGK